MWVKKQQLELDMKQGTGPKLGTVYKGIYCYPTYLTYMQSTCKNGELDESQAGVKITRRNINNVRYADANTLMAECEENLNSLLKRVKKRLKKLA